MARKIEAMPGFPSRPSYPWDEWLDGDVWELIPGEDFAVPAKSMVAMALQTGQRRGIRVVARPHNGRVYIQAHLNGGPGEV